MNGRGVIRHQHLALKDALEGPQTQFYERLKSKAGKGWCVALCGARYIGKTQLGVWLCQDARARKAEIWPEPARHKNWLASKYRKGMDLFLDVRATFANSSHLSERDVVQEYADTGLLVLDELHEPGGRTWQVRLLTHLIDERYMRGWDTLLLANLPSSKEFADLLGESVVRRIEETGEVCHADWPTITNLRRLGPDLGMPIPEPEAGAEPL